MQDGSILLVEDNKKDELLTIRALGKISVANPIDVVRDGQQAIDYLLGKNGDGTGVQKALPTLVILDLKLPKLDGHEVLQQIRSQPRTKLLPVVILTSSGEEEDVRESYILGANSFVCKPVNIDEFTRAIKKMGLYWLIINRAAKNPDS